MRYVASLVIACVIALVLFRVMFALVNHQQQPLRETVVPVMVDIRPLDIAQPQQVQAQKITEQAEPVLAPLGIAPMAATAIDSDITVELPEADLQWENTEAVFEQQYWSQPAGEGAGTAEGQGGVVDDYIGEMNAGKKITVPASSSRPNIPKLAYENKINGWVLLAFTVSNTGKVKNIRVMDAYPRGVFEANAIEAMRGWVYSPFKGPDIQLSQRIEFDWTMYPYNMERQ